MMRIIVADEISPDSCRLWDVKSNREARQGRFRRDLGGLLEAYTEVAKRLGILMENERPIGSGPVLVRAEVFSESARHGYTEVRHPRSAGQGHRRRAEIARVDGVASVRQGKVFDIELSGFDVAKAEAALKDAADKLLANTVNTLRPHAPASANRKWIPVPTK